MLTTTLWHSSHLFALHTCLSSHFRGVHTTCKWSKSLSTKLELLSARLSAIQGLSHMAAPWMSLVPTQTTVSTVTRAEIPHSPSHVQKAWPRKRFCQKEECCDTSTLFSRSKLHWLPSYFNLGGSSRCSLTKLGRNSCPISQKQKQLDECWNKAWNQNNHEI